MPTLALFYTHTLLKRRVWCEGVGSRKTRDRWHLDNIRVIRSRASTNKDYKWAGKASRRPAAASASVDSFGVRSKRGVGVLCYDSCALPLGNLCTGFNNENPLSGAAGDHQTSFIRLGPLSDGLRDEA